MNMLVRIGGATGVLNGDNAYLTPLMKKWLFIKYFLILCSALPVLFIGYLPKRLPNVWFAYLSILFAVNFFHATFYGRRIQKNITSIINILKKGEEPPSLAEPKEVDWLRGALQRQYILWAMNFAVLLSGYLS